jgi:hypothetical protein
MEQSPLSEFRDKKWHNEVKINGKWITYGICSENFNTKLIKGEYIGTSKEIRIDGKIQKIREVKFHFWKIPKK